MAVTFTCDYCGKEYEVRKVYHPQLATISIEYKHGRGKWMHLSELNDACTPCFREALKAKEDKLKEIKRAKKV